MSEENTAPNYLAMSDEELSNTLPPEPAAPEETEVVDDTAAPDTGDQNDSGSPAEGADDEPDDTDTPAAPVEGGGERGPDGRFLKKDKGEFSDDGDNQESAPKAKTPSETPEEPEGEAAPQAAEPKPEEYKEFYDRILGKPIRANGKDIQLKSPEEAERAIQMGLNYTKKMQALQPHLRLVKMLDNNKLMDEKELSYLIDLHQRKTEAIQKLLADSQFDPHTVDADEAAQYVPGNHQVSDVEMQFNSVLDELESTDEGRALLNDVAGKWDQGSKQAIFKDPRLLAEINRQKAMGLYDRIASEVEHRQALGQYAGAPFLAAYEQVGKELHAQGLLVPRQETPAPRVPVETRVATPAPKVKDSDKARAASSPRTSPAAKTQDFNPLNMSDDKFDEYMKKMEGRV